MDSGISVYLIGGGGHAKQVIDIFLQNNIIIAGIFDDKKIKKGYREAKYCGAISDIVEFIKTNRHSNFFCAIGSNQIRKQIVECLGPHVSWLNCISSNAYISPTAKLGKGNYIGNYSKILSDTVIGNFNIINEGSTITHDNVVGDFNHIAPHACLGGNVTVGNSNLIGTSSVINLGKTINDSITIGSGGVVVNNLVEPGVYVGVPAKLVIK